MRTTDELIEELKEEAGKMSALMTDVVLGAISPKVCNAACSLSAKRQKEIAATASKAAAKKRRAKARKKR